MFDATFWVAISFVIFCLIIVYKKIPQVINNLLDNKINEIKSEIDNAKNLKNESEQLLEKYKKKIEDAHMERSQILNSEKKETEIFIQESENKFEQLILNKKKSLEQKLDQMKVKAIKDMQNISNKIALEAVKKIISNSANDEKMKVINQKNLEKIFINLTNTKAS
ncbi:ATP synthase subunit b 1 [Candidatus Pelagibacterales bacterium]|jgi:F-type H+-transporting ATPase subunit b|nr:ATP synthase subunit b 1 [Pelagibacterales bacterium]